MNYYNPKQRKVTHFSITDARKILYKRKKRVFIDNKLLKIIKADIFG